MLKNTHKPPPYIIFKVSEGCGVPLRTHPYLLLFLLPIACLNFEQTIAGISISIYFRTVVANSNNYQTHPVCYLLTNEINPSENIFNNVMQNGISKIEKFIKIENPENIRNCARPACGPDSLSSCQTARNIALERIEKPSLWSQMAKNHC